jgi:hypothetical protein
MLTDDLRCVINIILSLTHDQRKSDRFIFYIHTSLDALLYLRPAKKLVNNFAVCLRCCLPPWLSHGSAPSQMTMNVYVYAGMNVDILGM